jgi:hypothetical protein
VGHEESEPRAARSRPKDGEYKPGRARRTSGRASQPRAMCTLFDLEPRDRDTSELSLHLPARCTLHLGAWVCGRDGTGKIQVTHSL